MQDGETEIIEEPQVEVEIDEISPLLLEFIWERVPKCSKQII